uniref:Peptidase S1 domain-containing protein n=1 Tax=Romanomermis culicivorax TaxID=13658 RepID=A0A915I1R1_ROMCU
MNGDRWMVTRRSFQRVDEEDTTDLNDNFSSFRPENYYVSFGKHDYWVEKETNQMDVKVVKAIIHSDYIRESRYDDIAMLKLERPVKFSTFVRPITLSNFTLAELDHCFISGWGGTNSTLKLRIANINKTHLIERDSGIIVDDLDDNPIPVEDSLFSPKYSMACSSSILKEIIYYRTLIIEP